MTSRTTKSQEPGDSGFTLIETMVAVTILTLSIVGPLYVADRAVVAAATARDQLVANYLAQEGIEYVRAMRDNEFLGAYAAGGTDVSTLAWDAFINGSSAGSIASCRSQACTLDPVRPMGTGGGFALAPCSGSACGILYLSGGLYTEQSSGGATPTPFTRTIQATLVSAQDMHIVARVSWVSRGTAYTVSVADHLTPWQ